MASPEPEQHRQQQQRADPAHDVLSQEEVDALLGAVAPELPEEAAASEEEAAPWPQEVVPMQQYQQEVAVEVFSDQLAKKRAPGPRAMRARRGGAPEAPQALANVAAPGGGGAPANLAPPQAPIQLRPKTDTYWSWNALPNEWIVPLGKAGAKPVLGGSVSKVWNRGVVRFPSSVQRIEFSTDNISSENQGVLVEGWACWRVSDPEKAVEKLDFSDINVPMLNTSKILAIECAGIMKGLISVKTVQDLLKRREDLIDQIREKLKPTEARWGLSFDELGISEVQILSQDVFENLQRPFRNEAREVAATSDLDTEERIASKQAVQRERVAKLESENETAVHEIQMAEEQKRLLQEQEISTLRIDEEKRVSLQREQAEREVERARVEAERQATLAALTAEEQRRLTELRAEDERSTEEERLEATRRQKKLEAERAIAIQEMEAETERTLAEQRAEAERELEQVKLDAARAEAREKAELQRIALAQDVAEATRKLEEARKAAEVAIARLELEAEVETIKARLGVREAQELLRLKVAAEDRKIGGQLSDAEIRAKLVESLPSIASSIKVGDVRWYGGGQAGDVGPAGILGKALDQVLDIAESHGITLGKRSGNGGLPEGEVSSEG